MTLRRLVAVLVGVWLFVLAVLLQSQPQAPPTIRHAQRVDRPPGDLPTLPPLKP